MTLIIAKSRAPNGTETAGRTKNWGNTIVFVENEYILIFINHL